MLAKNSLRVLSGKFRGKAIKSPQNSNTHPMGSREKLALFNMLGVYLENANVLDAYAGTGALGIEALSRGALVVTFVEKNPSVVRIIRENLREIGIKESAEVFTGSVKEFSSNIDLAEKYDLILADPPYDKFNVSEIVELISLLKKGGILALSYPFKAGVLDFSNLELQTSRKYAAAGIAIYRKNCYN